MAWCHQADSRYLSQCWPRSMLPFGVTWPQWVNTLRFKQHIQMHFSYEKFCNLFVHKVPIDNNSTLVQIMAWCLFGTMPVPEPMLTKIVWHQTASPGHNGLKTVYNLTKFDSTLVRVKSSSWLLMAWGKFGTMAWGQFGTMAWGQFGTLAWGQFGTTT